MAVGEQNSLGVGYGQEQSARMFNTKYFQMCSVFSKKVFAKISHFLLGLV